MRNFSDRLKFLVKQHADGKPTVFAKKAGITVSAFHAYINGRLPQSEQLILIREFCGVNLNWLLTGDGTPYIKECVCLPPVDSDGAAVPSNIIEMDHMDLVKQFKDKLRAKNVNEDLVQIEVMDRDVFIETVGYIRGVRISLESKEYAGDRAAGESPAGDALEKKGSAA